jgi:heme/copper-type cytochrome/quinol oxidase subunit 1
VIEPAVLERARSLTLRYLYASSLILLVSGLFGVVIRFSQAGYARVGANAWYALMTAHGLGAFLGWAGFAVMGFPTGCSRKSAFRFGACRRC